MTTAQEVVDRRRNRYATDPEYRAHKIKQACDWNRDNQDKRLDANLRRRYGITLVQFREMEAAQGGVCAICKQPETETDWQSGRVRRLCVDHCHVTNKVRGLLCRKCNHTLGLFEDEPEIFLAMAGYLRRDFRELA